MDLPSRTKVDHLAQSTSQSQKNELEGRRLALEKTKDRREALQRQIEQLDRLILEGHQQYLDLHNSMLPVARLPSAILATIFQILQQETTISNIPAHPMAEVTISHVCALWRSLALSIPLLWRVFRHDSRKSGSASPDRLQAYLDRSGEHPLELYFKFAGSRMPNKGDINMLPFVPAHLRRCRRLHVVSINDYALMQDLFKNPDKADDAFAPMLESLSLSPGRDLGTSLNRQHEWLPNILRSGAPSLKYVRLDGSAISHFRPPLDSIVDLRLEACYHPSVIQFGADVLAYILTLPCLETLSVTADFFTPDRFETAPFPIKASSLKHFRCSAQGWQRGGHIACYFLSSVSSPLLETIGFFHLKLDQTYHPPHWRRNYHYPSLRTLALIAVDCDTESSFATVRQVKHLVLSGSYGRLGWSRERYLQMPWPGLEELTLNYPTFHSHQDLVGVWPQLKTLHVQPTFVEDTLKALGKIPSVPAIKIIDYTVPFIPDFDWKKNDKDPYSAEIPGLWEAAQY